MGAVVLIAAEGAPAPGDGPLVPAETAVKKAGAVGVKDRNSGGVAAYGTIARQLVFRIAKVAGKLFGAEH